MGQPPLEVKNKCVCSFCYHKLNNKGYRPQTQQHQCINIFNIVTTIVATGTHVPMLVSVSLCVGMIVCGVCGVWCVWCVWCMWCVWYVWCVWCAWCMYKSTRMTVTMSGDWARLGVSSCDVEPPHGAIPNRGEKQMCLLLLLLQIEQQRLQATNTEAYIH